MKKMYRAMIIDDEQGSIEALKWVLKDDFSVHTFTQPTVAVTFLEKNPDSIDIVFLDLMMDEMSGVDVLKEIKRIAPRVECVVVTACRDKNVILNVSQSGVHDVIEKPFSVTEIKDKAESALQKSIENNSFQRVHSIIGKVVRENNRLADMLLTKIYDNDQVISGHSRRVSDIFSRMTKSYFNIIDNKKINELKMMAYLHDLGKLGIRQDILRKKDSLDKFEYNEVKKHPIIGYKILKKVEFNDSAIDVVLHHQERYDGMGYPHRLKGDEISQFSRMIAVVDAFDAMTDNRPYRKGVVKERALCELKRNSGTQFDPQFVDFFVDNMYTLTCENRKTVKI